MRGAGPWTRGPGPGPCARLASGGRRRGCEVGLGDVGVPPAPGPRPGRGGRSSVPGLAARCGCEEPEITRDRHRATVPGGDDGHGAVGRAVVGGAPVRAAGRRHGGRRDLGEGGRGGSRRAASCPEQRTNVHPACPSCDRPPRDPCFAGCAAPTKRSLSADSMRLTPRHPDGPTQWARRRLEVYRARRSPGWRALVLLHADPLVRRSDDRRAAHAYVNDCGGSRTH